MLVIKVRLENYLKKYNIKGYNYCLKWPMYALYQHYFDRLNFSFFHRLVAPLKNARHFRNSVYNLHLLSLFKDPYILSAHVAYELTKIRRKHTSFFKAFDSMLKENEFLPQQIFEVLKIKIQGKVNASLRTKYKNLENGPCPSTRTFSNELYYFFSHSHARTGVFGVHVWAKETYKITSN